MMKKVLFLVVFALVGLMGMAQDLKDLYPVDAKMDVKSCIIVDVKIFLL